MPNQRTLVLKRYPEYTYKGIVFKQDEPRKVDSDMAELLMERNCFIELRNGLQKTADGDFQVADSPPKEIKNTLGSDDLNGKRVLLRRNGAIGDVVFVATLADHLKRSYPACEIHIAVRDNLKGFASSFDCISKVLSIDESTRMDAFESYDYIIPFDGVIEGGQKDDKDYFVQHWLAAGLDAPPEPTFPALGVNRLLRNSDVRRDAEKILRENGIGDEPYLAVVLGTSNPLKTLHVGSLSKLVKSLSEGEQRMRVLCIGDYRRDRVPELDSKTQWLSVANNQPLAVSAYLIAKSKAVFGCDTGLVQLAAAMSKPTVAYFGPTQPALSIGHYPGLKKAVQSTMHCSPCMVVRSAYCPYFNRDHPECMRGVDTDSLANDVRAVFAQHAEDELSIEPASSVEEVLTPQQADSVISASDLNVCMLLDNSEHYTGGGYYVFSLAKSFAAKTGVHVWLWVDHAASPYLKEPRPENLHVVLDEGLRNGVFTHPDSVPFDLIVAQPPSIGFIPTNYAEGNPTCKTALCVYETPNYIRAYREGLDADEAYWADYKAALEQADFIFCISKIVKDKLYEWLPSAKNRTKLIRPCVNDKAYKKDYAGRGNSAVLISRNMPYKGMKEAICTTAKALTAFAKEDDPLYIYAIGPGTKALHKYIDQALPPNVRLECYEDIADEAKWAILAQAQCLIHPSIFEGFGLPVAEALLARVPVVCRPLPVFKETYGEQPIYYTTDAELSEAVQNIWQAWDGEPAEGLMEFLDEGYDFARKRFVSTKMNVLVNQFIKDNFAETLRSKDASRVQQATAQSRALRVAMVTTWGNRCGIAETTSDWMGKSNFTWKVFAPHLYKNENLEKPDNDNVLRCWYKDFDAYNQLLNELVAFSPDVVHFQHEFSFFGRKPEHEKTFFSLLKELRERNIKTVVTLHTYAPSGFTDRLAESCDKVVVTKSTPDVEGNPRYQVIDLPVHLLPRVGTDEARRKLSWNDRPRFIVGSFGMWNEHKGYDKFIETFHDAAQKISTTLRYVIAGYRAANNSYAQETLVKNRALMESGQLVTFTDYMPMQQVHEVVSTCDVLVYNYNVMGHHSASAAIRTGMAAGRPIICTPSTMFGEFANEEHVLKVPYGEKQSLTDAIVRLYADRDLCRKLVANCDKYIQECTSEKVAAKHQSLYEGLVG